ncbi:SF1B family DNA helicase RecD2 [Peptoniphilus catoniae]|uniref:SF1B family DNA helicase RecD2 n=1 Tax=Peptoniphilus catoniae TaxID=1660341 RepID=UPI0010FE36B2|nr:ATP-dependent RecD-like DNA helicase [Peptoniphilus catoniae]
MIEIKAVIERIIYRNEDNGYTIARVNSEDEDLVVVGNCMEIKTSMEYIFRGDFVFHKKYGEQFKFEDLEEILPKSQTGIINYLSSGVIPFIGEKTAKAIVDKFKEESLTIIENNPDRLLEIEGIGEFKLEKIKSSLEKNKGLRKLIIFLTSYGLSSSYAIKIYKSYGEDSISLIKENPYKLAEDIRGIGFKKADEIAIRLGNVDPSFRAKAALKYTLFLAALEGHSYLPQEELLKRTEKLLNIDEKSLREEVIKLTFDDRFFIERNEEGDFDCYYAPYLQAENYISGKIKSMLKYPYEKVKNLDQLIDKVEGRQNLKFAANQIKAVKESVENGILIITGGPGTGKTTTLKAIIEVFELLEKSVKLAAPTGRAAKRMKEATMREAMTIHRLLEIGFSSDDRLNYGYEEETTLDCDVLIVDEVSMVDLILMNTLLKSVKEGTRLILVGDRDQLPSVGAGNVLKDLIESDKVPLVNLDEIFRQSEESMIIKNAHLINKGKMPEITNSKDFFMINEPDQLKTSEIIADLVNRRLPDYYGIDKKDIQVLCPMKKGPVGVKNLNDKLQTLLNPKGDEVKYGDNIFRVGDKVMHTKNNYNLEYKIESDFYLEEGEGVFNGDIGYIEKIDKEEKEVYVRYDDVKLVKYEYEDLDELMLAYASTIHKSQGSEFDVVIIPLHFAPPILLTRNLIYTAITRAKKLVVLVGEYKYLKIMVDNNTISKRYSRLKERLQDESN